MRARDQNAVASNTMSLRNLPRTYKLPLARRIPLRGACQASAALSLVGFSLILLTSSSVVAQENPPAEAAPPTTSCMEFTQPKNVEDREALRACLRKMREDRKAQRNQERLQRIYDGSITLTEQMNRFLNSSGASAAPGSGTPEAAAPPPEASPPPSSP